jgi:DNA repair protein RadD
MPVLRDYQKESIERLRSGFKEGHTRQILCAATGGGKSVIMTSMIESAVEKGSRVLFICERRILVEQFSRHLDEIGVEHGVLMSGHWRFKPHYKVQVATAQTLEKMDSWPNFDVVFIDEIHAAMRKSVVSLFENRPRLRVVGATATPFHKAIPQYFSNVVNVITMQELVRDGFLVPFRVFVAHEINTDGVKVVAGEWQKDELETRGRQIVGDVVADYIRISTEVFGIHKKTICFSCGVAHGTELADKFNEAGIYAVQISYKDTDDHKAEVLKEFAKPDTQIKIVISSDILTRGFDQPDVEHVILARPLKKSFSSHVQMVGRGARPYPDKEFCVIQDHSGNWLRFAESWEDLHDSGVQVLDSEPDNTSRKEPTAKEKEAAKCPRCGHVWGRSDFCLNCGYVRPVINQVEALPGEMLELSGAKKEKYSSEYKQAWYHGMIGHLMAIGKNENRAYHLYKEKFGVGPAWEKKAGPIIPEVISYLQYANILYAKSVKKAA